MPGKEEKEARVPQKLVGLNWEYRVALEEDGFQHVASMVT